MRACSYERVVTAADDGADAAAIKRKEVAFGRAANLFKKHSLTNGKVHFFLASKLVSVKYVLALTHMPRIQP